MLGNMWQSPVGLENEAIWTWNVEMIALSLKGSRKFRLILFHLNFKAHFISYFWWWFGVFVCVHVCVWVCRNTCAMLYLWSSENNFWGLVLSTMVHLELMWVLSPPARCRGYRSELPGPPSAFEKGKNLVKFHFHRSDLDAIVHLSPSLFLSQNLWNLLLLLLSWLGVTCTLCLHVFPSCPSYLCLDEGIFCQNWRFVKTKFSQVLSESDFSPLHYGSGIEHDNHLLSPQ